MFPRLVRRRIFPPVTSGMPPERRRSSSVWIMHTARLYARRYAGRLRPARKHNVRSAWLRPLLIAPVRYFPARDRGTLAHRNMCNSGHKLKKKIKDRALRLHGHPFISYCSPAFRPTAQRKRQPGNRGQKIAPDGGLPRIRPPTTGTRPRRRRGRTGHPSQAPPP